MQVFTVKLIVSRQVHQGRVLETGGFTFPTRVFYKNVCGVKKKQVTLMAQRRFKLEKNVEKSTVSTPFSGSALAIL
jgi:hypothetical protein